MRFQATFLAALTLISTVALAKTDTSCSEGAAVDQIQCLAPAYGQSEQQLNAIYTSKIDALQKRQTFDAAKSIFFENLESRLRLSQRAWLQNREAQCELEAAMSVQASFIIPKSMACTIRLNNDRSEMLKNLKVEVK